MFLDEEKAKYRLVPWKKYVMGTRKENRPGVAFDFSIMEYLGGRI